MKSPFEAKPLHTKSYLQISEIDTLLENVDYIIMAAPSLLNAPKLPLHFTIILNTSDVIPQEIKEKLLEKFCTELEITKTSDMLNNRERIAFALTTQETPMPHHLVDDVQAATIPWKLLHIIDFLGESDGFKEAKDGLSGWSYKYN